jgi:hypothetical protein
MIAESWNFYPILLGCLKNSGSGSAAYILAINGESDVFQVPDSFLSCAHPIMANRTQYRFSHKVLLNEGAQFEGGIRVQQSGNKFSEIFYCHHSDILFWDMIASLTPIWSKKLVFL